MDFGMVKEKEPSETEKALDAFQVEKISSAAQTRFNFIEKRLTFESHPVFIQILQMEKSYFVWLGSIPPVLSHAHFSVPSKQDGEAITTTVLGNNSNADGESIAAKLIKKTGVPVMLSYNISETIPGIKEFAELKVFEALKEASSKN